MKFFVLPLFIFLCLLNDGCSSNPTPAPTPLLKNKNSISKSKQKNLKFIYHSKDDTISIFIKNQPLYKVLDAFKKESLYTIHYSPKELQKTITVTIKNKSFPEALKIITNTGGFLLEKSKKFAGFVIKSPWSAPALAPEELSNKIVMATKFSQIQPFLGLSGQKSLKPLVGAREEQEQTGDLYYAYRPIFQNHLWKQVSLLKKMQYHIPQKINNTDLIRVFYNQKKSEIICEILFLVNLTAKIHIIFQYTFHSLSLKKITLFVSSSQ